MSTKKYTNSIFESIKASIAKEDTKVSGYKDILKMEVGKTYIVRLLPNINDNKNTFFHHFMQGWESFATGQYVSALSPATFGEPDPISTERYKLIKNGTDAEKEKADKVRRSEKWLVNVYVVDDPTNPENNGTVKILRYGKQLHKIIDSAINGDDAAEFGSKIFDLSKEGCNFKIKCETQSSFPTYVSSRFVSPTDLKLTEDQIESIYNSVHDLTKIYQTKTYDELVEMWNTHFLCKTNDEQPAKATKQVKSAAPEATDIEPDASYDTNDDEQIKQLLAGI